MATLLDNKFEIGQEVYLKTDSDQFLRIVTGYCVRAKGISYELSCGVNTSWHYDFEMSLEKNVLAIV